MSYVPDSAVNPEFGARLDRIERRHSKLSRGYVETVNHDGLVVARPAPRSLNLPARGILFLAVALFGFKSLALAILGAAAYDERIDRLWQGETMDRMSAILMAPDIVSSTIADTIRPMFH